MLANLALAAALAVVPSARAHGSPDQVNDPETGTSYGCGGFAPLFQGFVPSRRQLVAVELRLRAGGSFPDSGTSFNVRIWRGPGGGEIVGSARGTVPGPVKVGATLLAHVDFAPALLLEPEGPFYIEGPTLSDAVLTWMGADTIRTPAARRSRAEAALAGPASTTTS